MELTLKQKTAFGIGAVGKDMVYALSASYVMYYYQDVLGLSASFVGVVLMAARFFDAFNDPFMGVLVAKTRTRWGRFRPWIFSGTLLNALVLYALFAAPVLDEAALMVYFSVVYILWGVTYTMMDIPYWSMIPAVTRTPKDRENLSMVGRTCAGVGSALIAMFTMLLVGALGGDSERAGFRWVALIVAAIFAVTELVCCISMKETTPSEMKTATVKEMFSALFRNDQAMVVVGSIVLINSALYLTSNFIIYFFKYDLGGAGWKATYCYFRKGKQFRLVASLDEKPGYTILRYDSGKALLTLERDCAGVEHPGGSVALFDLFFAEGGETEVFDGWFQAMGIKPRTEKKLAGYSSWYNRYQDITEDTIREDLTGCRSLLCLGDLFQIDDGWEPKVGDWLETDAQKFPHGLKGMVEEIHAAGFQAGLWLAPFVCEKDSALFRQHSDWLLKVDGAPWCCGCNWSSFYALDLDNPAVLDYLRRVFDRVLNDWGFDLVKLDFLYGAAPFGNARESRAARMYRAMELLRTWCGQKQILGCGVPVMPAFGLVDYCRVSCDVGLDWDDVWYMRLFHRERVSTKQAINNTLFRRQLNGRAYGSDPDVFFLREENCKLTAEQKRTLATVNALLGNVFLTSDMPSHYTDAQRAEYRRLRTLFEHATQVQVETENDRFYIRYLLDGTPQKLCFTPF